MSVVRLFGALLVFAALLGAIVVAPLGLWIRGAALGDGRMMAFAPVFCLGASLVWFAIYKRFVKEDSSGPPYGI